jgi:hypothetical protein
MTLLVKDWMKLNLLLKMGDFMVVLRIHGRNELVFSFEEFLLLIREYMGDDAEQYLLNYPVELAWEEFEKFKASDELLADGYLEQIMEAEESVGQLYQMILDSDFGKVQKYQKEKASLLTKLSDLKKILAY